MSPVRIRPDPPKRLPPEYNTNFGGILAHGNPESVRKIVSLEHKYGALVASSSASRSPFPRGEGKDGRVAGSNPACPTIAKAGSGAPAGRGCAPQGATSGMHRDC